MKLVVMITEKDGRFRASCPSLPGCVCYGNTREEAQREIEEAVYGYLASLNVAVTKPVKTAESPVMAMA